MFIMKQFDEKELMGQITLFIVHLYVECTHLVS